MKKFIVLMFFTLFLMKGYSQQNFTLTKVVGAAPIIGQTNFSLYKLGVKVNQNDSVGVNQFMCKLKCKGYSLVGFKALVDGSSSEMIINNDSVRILSQELKWYSDKVHTIEFICDVQFVPNQVGSPSCPTGQIELTLFNLIIGPMTLGSESIRFDEVLSPQILVGDLASNQYFTPNTVETLQTNQFVKAGEVKFSAINTSLSNDKLVLNIKKEDVKKVKTIVYKIGSDTFYEHATPTLYLTKPDSLKIGETLNVEIFYQIDSAQVKLIDSIQATLELRTFDHCASSNELVSLPLFKIDQKISKPNGINHKYQSSGFTVYPNPAHNILNISNLPEDSKIFIIDMTGKSIEMVAYGNQIDISSFVSGMYVIRIGEVTSKIFKQ